MTLGDALIVLVAGFGAGALTSSVGVASLVSFPVLVALGLPPVLANMTNAVGLVPAGVGGGLGYREEVREHPRLNLLVLVLTGLSGLAGAALLLVLPPGVFELVAPWLLLFTCAIVAVQPRLSRWLARRRESHGEGGDRVTLSPIAIGFTLLIGAYGGYFGAGAGVMMLALLALSLDLDLRFLAAMRTTSMLASKLTAAALFVVVAEIDWLAAGMLALGSVFGGYAGARVARLLPDSVLRGAVIVAGVAAAAYLFVA